MPRLLLLLALSALPAVAQPDWEVVDLGTTENLHALYRGGLPWVVGTNGFVASVANDYTTWTTHDVDTTEDLLSVIGPSASSRSIAGRNGTYRYTTDAGATWQSVDLPDTEQDYVVTRPNSTWFALGSNGAIYADLIGNPVSWIERPSGTTAALHDAESTMTVLVVGDEGTILRGDLVGEMWTPVESGTTADLHAVAVRSGGEWLVVGESGLILKSTDDGATWTPRESGTTATLRALDGVASALRYVVVGDEGTILETKDFGETWCRHDAGTTADLYAVAAPLREVWFVAGEGGLMLRSTTEGGQDCVAVASEPAAPAQGHTLSAAWPNPMRERAALALSVEHAQHVTAEVLNVLGRRVALLFDGPVAPGAAQTLVLERGGLTAGSYLVRVRGETFADVRAVTVLR